MWVGYVSIITKEVFGEMNDTRSIQNIRETRVSFQVWLEAVAETNEENLARAKRSLRVAIKDELTPRQQMFLQMYFCEGLSYQEIGEKCGVNRSTVCRSISRATATLRRCVKYALL